MEPSGLESNASHQELMSDSDSVDTGAKAAKSAKYTLTDVPFRDWVTICILCFVNLINYMDRFTIAGILPNILTDFGISDDQGGLIQTAFVLSYMIFAPLFGYLGDRYNRRYIMAFGVVLWSLTTLIGSYMSTFSSFMLFRAMVGIGEASYSTIAPTIISDMFVDSVRSKMLALFYFAIPVGSGLGYIVGSETAQIAGSWQWALRVTPILGIIAVILILTLMKEPERGEAEGGHSLHPTSWFMDIKELGKTKTFMLSTAGFTCVAFATGALSWWGPTCIHLGLKLQTGNANLSINDVSFTFGLITMVAGIIGVPLGSILGTSFKDRFPRIDSIICGLGLFLSAPLLLASILLVRYNTTLTFILIFLGQLFLNLNWSLVADILLYVVIPTRRSTAEAFQILVSHALGDAGSPYLIGLISENLKTGNATIVPGPAAVYERNLDDFRSLQHALFLTAFVEVLGGIFFLLAAIYIVKDKTEAERVTNAVRVKQQPRHLFAEDVSDSEQNRNLVS